MTTFVRRRDLHRRGLAIGDTIRQGGRKLRVSGICTLGDDILLLWARTPQGAEIRLSKREAANIRKETDNG